MCLFLQCDLRAFSGCVGFLCLKFFISQKEIPNSQCWSEAQNPWYTRKNFWLEDGGCEYCDVALRANPSRSHLLCGWNTLQGSSSFLPNESFTAPRKLMSSPILISAHIKLPHFNDLLPYTAHISLLFLMERGCSQKFWRSEFSIACSCCFEILMTDK